MVLLPLFAVRAPNFVRYTLFKISWQFLIKVPVNVEANNLQVYRIPRWSVIRLSAHQEAWVQPLVVEQDFTSCAAWQGGSGAGWGLSGRWNKRKKNLQFYDLKLCYWREYSL